MQFDDKLIDALRRARYVAVLTGAGVSAESGLPTFRDAMTGLWANYRPEDLATADAFRRDPKLVWDWYKWRRERAAAAEPNDGRYALVSIASKVHRFTLITQNVDGLHQKAGSADVIELHGNIHRCKCFDEGDVFDTWDDDGVDVPRCPRCRRAYLRPDVVWFGENLPEDAFKYARLAASTCDVFLSIGTSGLVQPAAGLLDLAGRAGALTCVVNKDVSGFSGEDCLLEGPSGAILPALVQAVWA